MKPEAEAHGSHVADPHPSPVPRDADLPQATEGTLVFFAAGSLVVFVVALLTLI